MTERPSQPDLERTLREALRRRDPGSASSALRTWTLGVPEEIEHSQSSQPRRPFTAVIGLAALMLLAVIGLMTVRQLSSPGGTGATLPEGSASSPSVVGSPVAAFDPTLEGPGVSAADDLSPAILVVAACGLLGVLVITGRGWRRSVPAVLGALLAGWALVGALAPVTVGFSGFGPGLNVVQAPSVPGSSEELLYELAPPSGRFSVGLLIHPSPPLPVRIEGIVSPTYAGRDGFLGVALTAIWIDGEPHGGMTGPARPFTPFDVPRNGQAIWLVGRAGGCALGSAFDPLDPAVVGFQFLESLDLRVSVLGWPRTIHLALPFRLVEPQPSSCPTPTPVPAGSTPAEASSR